MTLEKKYVTEAAATLLHNAEIPQSTEEIFASGQWLLKQVRKHDIQNIVLMERSAILLRAGLRSLMQQNGVKVYFTSVAPEDAVCNPQVFERLSRELTEHPGNTLLLDEHWVSGARIMRLYQKLSQDFPGIKIAAMSRARHGSTVPLTGNVAYDLLGFGGLDTFYALRTEVTGGLLQLSDNNRLVYYIYRKIITVLRDCFVGQSSFET